ncbi:MAG: molybdopterin molybdenumtransferase MoeA, partial [Anaerolineae bacterium]|nr:molybdopterin molybdenumtransferase MoeA [Anaerolineae bacterium]
GYAVHARDTFGASDSLPAYLSIAGEAPMGRAPDFALQPGQAALIHTGGMLPEGADAVVMIENTQTTRPGEVEILRAAAPGENVLNTGEDVHVNQVVIPEGTRLRPSEIGGLAALGILQVPVVAKPTVAILSSGDEVIPPEQTPLPGQVRDVNSYSLSALVDMHDGAPRRFGIMPDRPEAVEDTLRTALASCDIVVITAGSSASTRDFTADVIDRAGKPGVLVHGVNDKPGKPTILGVCDGKAVIGLPGNPVSALVIAGLFVVPLLRLLQGLPVHQPEASLRARLTANIPSQAGREDYMPVTLLHSPDGWLAEPIFYKSNLIFSLAQANGLVKIDSDATGLSAGDEINVRFF